MSRNLPRWVASRSLGSLVAAGLLVLTLTSRVSAQSGENVLLIVNSTSPASQQIADRYARARAVPQDNVLRLALPSTDQISRVVFESQIEGPIAKWLNRSSAHDRILYLVLTKGVPLRVAGTSGRNGTVASVDSELTLLYRKMTGLPVAPQGSIANPYFLGDRPLAEAKPFTHEALDIFLVTRLDAFTVDDALALIDRAQTPLRTGRIALDEKSSLTPEPGNRWLERSAQLLKAQAFGDRVMLDSTSQVIANQSDLLGYYSWGSNDPAIKSRDLHLAFVPGALAAMFVSTDARTFKEPPPLWTLGRWEDARSYFEGSPQSLSGDLIRAGVTGVAGHVAEPYLDATIRPDVLFPAYVSGFNLAESFYLAMPFLSWQTVVVGDPLAAPFRTHTLTGKEIDRGLDVATEYPAYFSAKMVQIAVKSGTVPEVARLIARANGRLARDDRAGAQQALEQATALEPRLGDAQLRLAMLYDASGEFDKAIARYRLVLVAAPNQVAALNNLAYDLSTHRSDALPEALQVAQRAVTLARGEASVNDTLAWVLHLSGDDAEARRVIHAAVLAAPNNAPILLHAAVIDAAGGAYEDASRELASAVALDPELDKQQETQQLRTKLTAAGRP